MNKIRVGIEGTSPLLMHNPAVMREAGGGKKVIPTPEEEAAASRYLIPGTTDQLALKDDHIHQCIKVAGRGFRIQGRESVGPYLAGSIEIQPAWIPLGTTKYEIDMRRAVLQGKNGVVRSRALVWPWAATFELWYDPTVFAAKFLTGTLRDQIFKRAGTAIGLLDYRPSKGGKFGRFVVTMWEGLRVD